MESFIAFCKNKNCGAVFSVPNFIGGTGNATITLTNTTIGPCPVCESNGFIPDGIYNYANQAISLLTGPNSTIQILSQVNQILSTAKKEKNITREEVLEKVEAISPEAAKALENAPDNSNFIQWIMMAIAIITLAIQVDSTYFSKEDIEKEFREYLLKENSELKQQMKKNVPYKREKQKLKRNEPCPCGSQKKYKNCCKILVV